MTNAHFARRSTFALFALLAALPAAAQQQVFAGRQAVVANSNFSGTVPYTLVNFIDPINADGNLTSGSVLWTGAGCANAFKIKILRPVTIASLNFTFVGERGPFSVQDGFNSFALSPALPVKKGDFLAISVLQPAASCGTLRAGRDGTSAFFHVSSEITAAGTLGNNIFRNVILPVRVTDSSEVLEGVLTAAGSLAGGFGSFFRTSVQLAAPQPAVAPTTGKLVFHRAGVAASAGDPSIPFSLAPSAVVSFNDVVASMGQSGLGTLDVVTTSGAPPQVSARIFNDLGAAGTSGFNEELVRPVDLLHQGDTVSFITPADLTNFRVNIGVRVFGADAQLTVLYGSRTGAIVPFAGNTFQQVALTALSGVAPQANERMTFTVTQGSGDVIIYASITDNRTNDSAIQFLRRE